MARRRLFPFCLFLLLALGIATFPVDRSHSPALSSDEIRCGLDGAHVTYDNPIERAFMRGFSVTGKEGSTIFVSAYTVAGITISRIAANCKMGNFKRL